MTIRNLLALLFLEMALATVVLLGAMAAGHANPIGWRIAVQACTPRRCRDLTPSDYRWAGKYACQGRAARIAEFADLTHLLPAGTRVSARCLPVEGTPGA